MSPRLRPRRPLRTRTDHYYLISANYTLRGTGGGALNIRSNSSQGFINPLYFNGSLHVSTNPDPQVREPQFSVKIMGSDIATLRQLNLCFSNSSRDGGLAIYVRHGLPYF